MILCFLFVERAIMLTMSDTNVDITHVGKSTNGKFGYLLCKVAIPKLIGRSCLSAIKKCTRITEEEIKIKIKRFSTMSL